MPDKIKDMVNSLLKKGGPIRPTKSSTKTMNDDGSNRRTTKIKEKFYNLGDSEVSVKKTKEEDEYGNMIKKKEVSKSYYNPLNNERVTVDKVKEGGIKTKEVHRDKDNESESEEGGKKIAKIGIKAMTEKLKKKKEEEEE